MKTNTYQELHIHTVGSYRDGANTVKDIFDAAEEKGYNAVAITDHGNWTRLFEAFRERTKREKKVLEKELNEISVPKDDINKILKIIGDFGTVSDDIPELAHYRTLYPAAFRMTEEKRVKFIPGIEMYEGDDEKSHFHLCLYAKDWEGLQVLFGLTNVAQLNQRNGMPRCTVKTLREYIGKGSKGHNKIVATSACIAGKIPATMLFPFKVKSKITELERKKAEASKVPAEALTLAEDAITKAEAELAKTNEEFAQIKRKAKKNFSRAIAKLEKEISKAEAASSQNSLLTPLLPNNIQTLNKELKELKEQEAEAVRCCELVIPTKERIASLKADLKSKKEYLKMLQKENAPAEKYNRKIENLQSLLKEDNEYYEVAIKYAKEYKEIFGEGNFFIELQNHGILDEQIVIPKLIDIAKICDLPLTISNDVHYKTPLLARKRNLIAATRFPDMTIADVENQEGNTELYFKTTDEMIANFKSFDFDIEDAIKNTNIIAAMCNVAYKKAMHLPVFKSDKYSSPELYLQKIACFNIEKRYPDCKSWSKEKQAEFKKRLFYELSIINKMGYASYISIVEDFISYAKNEFGENSVGPGRGSGAGSLVCYLIGITDIDPLKYGLIFERFLNPERVSMPDIDTDFAPSIRDEVVKYVSRKYAYKGDFWCPEVPDTVCNITAEGTLAARKSIRQVGRVTGVPLNVCDKVAKLIPNTPKITISKALEESQELNMMFNTNQQVRELLLDAMLVEGTPDQIGVHAAGVIIADKPVTEYAPMFWNENKQCWVIQYDMIACENDLGLLKMDFLALRNLDIIMKTEEYIKKTKGLSVSKSEVLKADDADVYKNIYSSGNTNGIFQFESIGMKQTLRNFVPMNIEDIILLNAAYRPGPMQYIPEITEVKMKRKEASYIIPEMESILGVTYGSPIYQEQIQKIFHEIAGFSLGQADIIRRAMSKKHLDELEAAKDGFILGLKNKGADGKNIEELWQQLLAFASYAFNKSHAAAYSILSYFTAFLKEKFPVEYLASLMAYSTKDDVAPYIRDAELMGIKVLPPNINYSMVQTVPTEQGEIKYGLEAIKSVGASAEKIVAEREKNGSFTSYSDFLFRSIQNGVNKSTIEALILSGTLDDFINTRKEAFENLDADIKSCRTALDKHIAFEETRYSQFETLRVSYPEYSTVDFFALEKEYAGFYISGNPVAKYKDQIGIYKTKEIETLDKEQADVIVAGYIDNFNILSVKKTGEKMCKFTLTDLTDSIEVICFAFNYRKIASQLGEGFVICGQGDVRIEYDGDGNMASKQLILKKAKKI